MEALVILFAATAAILFGYAAVADELERCRCRECTAARGRDVTRPY